MSFQQGLSGLNASSKSLDVIGNNIANANTFGMKASRAEFADLIASASGTGYAEGIGVEVNAVAQDFSQGNISITGNSLDVAINGKGFFEVESGETGVAYTRAGNFKMDDEGQLMTNQKNRVMGYGVDPITGSISGTARSPIVLPTSKGIAGKATQNDPNSAEPAIKLVANLDGTSNAYDPSTNTPPYTSYGTSLNVFDAQGNAVPVSIFFTKTGLNQWQAHGFTKSQLDEFTSAQKIDPSINFSAADTYGTNLGSLTFAASDDLTATPPLKAGLIDTNKTTFTPWLIDSSASGQTGIDITPDLSEMTQYGARFTVSTLSQNGYSSGELTGITIDDKGLVAARYSNGKTFYQAKLAMINFRNEQGLIPAGAGTWIESLASGTPVPGEAGEGSFGSIRSGALEDSNVDLTGELVNMMTAQRAYQANAQTIKTQDQVLTTLVNLK